MIMKNDLLIDIKAFGIKLQNIATKAVIYILRPIYIVLLFLIYMIFVGPTSLMTKKRMARAFSARESWKSVAKGGTNYQQF